MASSLPKRALYTYADDLRWPEGARFELIDGVAYARAPAPFRLHQKVRGNLFRQAADALDAAPCEVYIAPFDVRLPQGDAADEWVSTMMRPDLSVICEASRLDERGCRGAPDWIVEVVLPSSSMDQVRKRVLYERTKVREYWLVQPLERTLTVYRQTGRFGTNYVAHRPDGGRHFAPGGHRLGLRAAGAGDRRILKVSRIGTA